VGGDAFAGEVDLGGVVVEGDVPSVEFDGGDGGAGGAAHGVAYEVAFVGVCFDEPSRELDGKGPGVDEVAWGCAGN